MHIFQQLCEIIIPLGFTFLLDSRSTGFAKMDFDDDAPPDLVETGAEVGEEEKTVKVPITIVTGKLNVFSRGCEHRTN